MIYRKNPWHSKPLGGRVLVFGQFHQYWRYGWTLSQHRPYGDVMGLYGAADYLDVRGLRLGDVLQIRPDLGRGITDALITITENGRHYFDRDRPSMQPFLAVGAGPVSVSTDFVHDVHLPSRAVVAYHQSTEPIT